MLFAVMTATFSGTSLVSQFLLGLVSCPAFINWLEAMLDSEESEENEKTFRRYYLEPIKKSCSDKYHVCLSCKVFEPLVRDVRTSDEMSDEESQKLLDLVIKGLKHVLPSFSDTCSECDEFNQNIGKVRAVHTACRKARRDRRKAQRKRAKARRESVKAE